MGLRARSSFNKSLSCFSFQLSILGPGTGPTKFLSYTLHAPQYVYIRIDTVTELFFQIQVCILGSLKFRRPDLFSAICRRIWLQIWSTLKVLNHYLVLQIGVKSIHRQLRKCLSDGTFESINYKPKLQRRPLYRKRTTYQRSCYRLNARCNRCTYSMTKCPRPRKPPCAPGSRSTPPGPSGTSASAPGLCFTHWLVKCEREFSPCNPLTELTPNWMFQLHPRVENQ